MGRVAEAFGVNERAVKVLCELTEHHLVLRREKDTITCGRLRQSGSRISIASQESSTSAIRNCNASHGIGKPIRITPFESSGLLSAACFAFRVERSAEGHVAPSTKRKSGFLEFA